MNDGRPDQLTMAALIFSLIALGVALYCLHALHLHKERSAVMHDALMRGIETRD